MRMLVVAATLPEIAPFGLWLDENWIKYAPGHYQSGPDQVSLLLAGAGMPQMAYAMGRVLALESYDLALNAGIAGALDSKLSLGKVVEVTSEYMADLGAEDRDGSFIPAKDLGLFNEKEQPFEEGWLYNPYSEDIDMLPKVRGITVNRVHGSEASIAALKNRVQAEVESMEGAAFFYACLQAKIPFLEIRSISNYVEPRNRKAWKVERAIQQLNETLVELIETLA